MQVVFPLSLIKTEEAWKMCLKTIMNMHQVIKRMKMTIMLQRSSHSTAIHLAHGQPCTQMTDTKKPEVKCINKGISRKPVAVRCLKSRCQSEMSAVVILEIHSACFASSWQSIPG
mmetsp:Transcript_6089/g.21532  ORF Transcript_6089/g.21532 Transcript_6089/m.21532 type:complete len:115 (+) Transcript_6089:86-430(+)